MPVVAVGLTPNKLHAATTHDLVALCGVDPGSPDYAIAISFSHGFAVGAFHYHRQVTGARGVDFVCMPNPPPSRSEASTQFITWTKARPETLDALPVDSMFRYLAYYRIRR